VRSVSFLTLLILFVLPEESTTSGIPRIIAAIKLVFPFFLGIAGIIIPLKEEAANERQPPTSERLDFIAFVSLDTSNIRFNLFINSFDGVI